MRSEQFDRLARFVAGERRLNRRTVAKLGTALAVGGTLGATNLGRPSPAGAVCGARANSQSCGATTICCAGVCVARNSSINCGYCYHSCSAAYGEYCVAGKCRGGSSSGGSTRQASGPPAANMKYESSLGYTLSWHDPTLRYSEGRQARGWVDDFYLTHQSGQAAIRVLAGNNSQHGPADFLEAFLSALAADAYVDSSSIEKVYNSTTGEWLEGKDEWGASFSTWSYVYEDPNRGGKVLMAVIWWWARIADDVVIQMAMYAQFDVIWDAFSVLNHLVDNGLSW